MFSTVGDALTAPLQMSEQLRNALIESFVIHLRNLVDFFYPAKIQADDVVAAEFFDDLDEWEKLSTVSPMLAASRVRAHKEISHLTRKRFSGTPPEKGWAIVELMQEIRKVLNEFTRAASPKRLSASVGKFGEAWK